MRAKRFSADFKTILSGVATATAVAAAVFALSINSFAASSGKILKDGVRVRKDASTNSDIVVSLLKDDSITINGQMTGGDGSIWYQITTASGENGYVRSDLATIIDGSTPDTIGADGNVTAADPSIRLVNPIPGTVKGDQKVRVRQDASTTSTIIDSLDTGTVVTIKGIKKSSDDRDWYFITYTNADGAEATGFSRSDFIEAGGEITDLVNEVPVENNTTEEAPVEEQAPAITKDFDTELQGTDWILYDYNGVYSNGSGAYYNISEIFSNLETYKSSVDKYKGQVTAMRVWLIIFIILAIAGLGGAGYFFMKLRDANDKAAFSDAEKQRRSRLMHRDSKPVQKPAQKPVGAKHAQAGRPQGGQRPMPGPNGRPQGGQRPMPGPNGARPQGGQRPMPGPNGARPQGGQRPMPGPNGARPQPGQRPMPGPNGRPAPSQGGRPVQNGRPVQRPTGAAPRATQIDDDDLEYEFLKNKGNE